MWPYLENLNQTQLMNRNQIIVAGSILVIGYIAVGVALEAKGWISWLDIILPFIFLALLLASLTLIIKGLARRHIFFTTVTIGTYRIYQQGGNICEIDANIKGRRLVKRGRSIAGWTLEPLGPNEAQPAPATGFNRLLWDFMGVKCFGFWPFRKVYTFTITANEVQSTRITPDQPLAKKFNSEQRVVDELRWRTPRPILFEENDALEIQDGQAVKGIGTAMFQILKPGQFFDIEGENATEILDSFHRVGSANWFRKNVDSWERFQKGDFRTDQGSRYSREVSRMIATGFGGDTEDSDREAGSFESLGTWCQYVTLEEVSFDETHDEAGLLKALQRVEAERKETERKLIEAEGIKALEHAPYAATAEGQELLLKTLKDDGLAPAQRAKIAGIVEEGNALKKAELTTLVKGDGGGGQPPASIVINNDPPRKARRNPRRRQRDQENQEQEGGES